MSAMDGKLTRINVPGFWAKIQYFRSHHPVAVGLTIIAVFQGIVIGPRVIRDLFGDSRTAVIPKYKSSYIVYRPDDPHVTSGLIKTGPVGWDKYGKYVS